jgi:hypothetical protein
MDLVASIRQEKSFKTQPKKNGYHFGIYRDVQLSRLGYLGNFGRHF